MSERIHALAQSLFGKASVEECNLQEIENLANRYPYFAPAQLLLLQKLKQEKAPAYDRQLQKAVLYYHNPLEFEYFINSEKFYVRADELPEWEKENASEIEDTHIEPAATEFQQQFTDHESIVEEPFTDTDEVQTEIPADAGSSLSEEQPNLDLQSDVEAAKEPDLIFEPYHTVDYFASQGIKPSLEQPKDKFGKQLKSFTEWLKTMKRLPASEMQKSPDISTEKSVVSMATHSVDDANVVTEAMAEVWIKQGNFEKAIEIYNKLSLLNPSKKTFFAAKIDNLNRS